MAESDLKANWVYFREGAANVACKYVGANAEYRDRILRISKANVRNLSWVFEVFLSFFGELIVGNYVQTSISKEHFIQILTQADRQEHRKQKFDISDVPEGRIAASILPDFTIMEPEEFIIELKPKLGMLEFTKDTSNVCINRHICSFCLKSKWKQIDIDYCPLDLFSRDESRVQKTVTALVDAPDCKNLKILGSMTLQRDDLISRITKTIISSDIFAKLRRMQILCKRGARYANYCFCKANIATTEPNAELQKRILSRISKFQIESQCCKSRDKERLSDLTVEPDDANFEDVDFEFEAYSYLLGRTAADVSIFLRFKNSVEYATQINVIDLDTKPLSKFSKWAKEREAMSKCFLKSTN